LSLDVDSTEKVISIIIGIVGITYGTLQFFRNRRLKRQEIILPLIREFDTSKKLQLAKMILDDFVLYPEKRMGWSIKEERYYRRQNLGKILRYPMKPEEVIVDQGEHDIRDSFSSLLDFFGKLGYLLDLGVITKKDLGYFQYYIRRARYHEEKNEEGRITKRADNIELIIYAKNYEFELFAVLLDKLGVIPKILDPLLKNYHERIVEVKFDSVKT
jgi:hypothetical protein